MKEGYYRPSIEWLANYQLETADLGFHLHGPDANLELSVGRCPFSTCIGGSIYGNLSGDPYCAENNATGLWCGQCLDNHYLDQRTSKSSCRPCQSPTFIGIMMGLLGSILLVSLFLMELYLRNGVAALALATERAAKSARGDDSYADDESDRRTGFSDESGRSLGSPRGRLPKQRGGAASAAR